MQQESAPGISAGSRVAVVAECDGHLPAVSLPEWQMHGIREWFHAMSDQSRTFVPYYIVRQWRSGCLSLYEDLTDPQLLAAWLVTACEPCDHGEIARLVRLQAAEVDARRSAALSSFICAMVEVAKEGHVLPVNVIVRLASLCRQFHTNLQPYVTRYMDNLRPRGVSPLAQPVRFRHGILDIIKTTGNVPSGFTITVPADLVRYTRAIPRAVGNTGRAGFNLEDCMYVPAKDPRHGRIKWHGHDVFYRYVLTTDASVCGLLPWATNGATILNVSYITNGPTGSIARIVLDGLAWIDDHYVINAAATDAARAAAGGADVPNVYDYVPKPLCIYPPVIMRSKWSHRDLYNMRLVCMKFAHLVYIHYTDLVDQPDPRWVPWVVILCEKTAYDVTGNSVKRIYGPLYDCIKLRA